MFILYVSGFLISLKRNMEKYCEIFSKLENIGKNQNVY